VAASSPEISKVAQGFFKNLFGGGASATQDKPGPHSNERISRRSTGFSEFTRAIAAPEGLKVLDLGPTSPSNITFITGLGHRAWNEDILLASNDKSLLIPGEDGKQTIDATRFLNENLAYEKKLFDAVLLWDVPDYLPESLVKPVVERIHTITKPGGMLLGFFHSRDAGPDAPYYRYHIANKETLELQQGPKFRLQRVFNNRHIETLFRDYANIKFFLGRDNIREILVIR
jgi:hypothetical protein